METVNKTRDRDQNFSSEESAIIKNKAWSEIEAAFLENPNIKNRNKDQLANRWKNLKT
uniref:Regulatory protein zeste n=1 Tax=Romanomermis culicivorax TaxID=13658 RepID=A0A915J794_ROMCU